MQREEGGGFGGFGFDSVTCRQCRVQGGGLGSRGLRVRGAGVQGVGKHSLQKLELCKLAELS